MPAGSCQVYGSVSGEDINSYPKYTGSPLLLFLADLWLFLRNIFYLPCIFLPLTPWSCGSLDELYPSLANIFDICLHCVLFVLQLVFLASLPLFIWLPFGVYVLYILTALALNTLICYALNRGIPADGLRSTEDDFSRRWNRHEDEYWIFLNGICVGLVFIAFYFASTRLTESGGTGCRITSIAYRGHSTVQLLVSTIKRRLPRACCIKISR